MTAAAHFVALLFAVPAGILAYFVLAADAPFARLHHVLVIQLLLIFALIGIPEIAGATIVYFLAAMAVTGWSRGQYHGRRQTDQVPPPEPKRSTSKTDTRGQPVIFKRQLKDD